MASQSSEIILYPLPRVVGSPRLTALVVEPSPAESVFFTATLTGGLFDVTVAHDFHHARALLETRQPTLLVTEIRLGDYNGLQLVLHARATQPPIAALVTSHIIDAVLRDEAERMSATFMLKPISRHDLLAAAYRTALCTARDATQHPIRAPYERRREERRMHLGEHVYPERRQLERRRDVTAALHDVASSW